MKCISQSTLGILLGAIIIIYCSIHFVCNVKFVPYVWNVLANGSFDPLVIVPIFLIFIKLILTIIAGITTGLLIAGIIKKSYKLMRPWIYFAIVFIFFEIVLYFTVFIEYSYFCGLFVIATSLLAFYNINMLYEDIRKNGQKPEEEIALNTHQPNPKSYTNQTKIADHYRQENEKQ